MFLGELSLLKCLCCPRAGGPGFSDPSEGATKSRFLCQGGCCLSIAQLSTLVALLAQGARWTLAGATLGNLCLWEQSSHHLRQRLPGGSAGMGGTGRVREKPGTAWLCHSGVTELSVLVSGRCLICRVLSFHKEAKLKFQLLTQFMVANPNCF